MNMNTEVVSKSNETNLLAANDDSFGNQLASIPEFSYQERPRIRMDKIRIIPNTLAINRDLIIQVKRSFPYVPDNSSVLNAMVVAGEYDIEEVKDHIFEAFSKPAKTTFDENKILRLKLLPDAFLIVKNYRQQLGRELFFTPDIHTVTNALLCTGDINPQETVAALTDIYKKPESLRVNYNPVTVSK